MLPSVQKGAGRYVPFWKTWELCSRGWEVISQRAAGTVHPPALPLVGLRGVSRALPWLLWSFSRNSAGLELSQPFSRLWVCWEGCSVHIAPASMAESSGGSWGQGGCLRLCSQAAEPWLGHGCSAALSS